MIYLPAEKSDCVLGRGNRTRHLKYSTVIEIKFASSIHGVEKMPMEIFMYDRQYCVANGWEAAPTGVPGTCDKLLCFEDFFWESDPAQAVENIRKTGQLPTLGEFRSRILCDSTDWDKIDSMDLCHHLSGGQQSRKPLSDYEVKIDTSMFFDKESVQRVFRKPEWPRGTEVVVYCWEEDREGASRQVEQWGYKLGGFINPADYMHAFIERGCCMLVLKSALLWKPDPNGSVITCWDNMIKED